MIITAPTPMMMPSMVRKARILLVFRDLIASLKYCVMFMPPPPPAGLRLDYGPGVAGVSVIDDPAVLRRTMRRALTAMELS